LKTAARFFGVSLLLFAGLSMLLTGYLAFTEFWILHHSTKVEATVLSGESRQRSFALTSAASAASTSSSYYFHCIVAYRAEGRDWQSPLDSPGSPHKFEREVWASTLSPGSSVAIRYYTADPARIRLADNPVEITAAEAFRATCYLLVPGVLLVMLSRRNKANSDS
jgi:hypothetical protein